MTSAAALRFDQIAANFVSSEVHSHSASIQRLHDILDIPPDSSVIDVACGAGHLALSFAHRVKRIVGLDGAPSMLTSFLSLAEQRGVVVETVHAMSHDIPFASETFDLAMSRLAPHHFPDIQASIQEMARIIRPGGFVAIIDLHGYDDPTIDALNHELEVLHDPTHVRSHPPATWRAAMTAAGLDIVAFETHRRESATGITIKRWCELAASGSVAENSIRERLLHADHTHREALGIVRYDNEFLIPVRTLLAIGRKDI
jgi:SAM-dependent methyltransferase